MISDRIDPQTAVTTCTCWEWLPIHPVAAIVWSFEHPVGNEWEHGRFKKKKRRRKRETGLEVKQSVQGKVRFLPLEASLSSLGFATLPLIDPSLDE